MDAAREEKASNPTENPILVFLPAHSNSSGITVPIRHIQVGFLIL